MVVRMTAHLEGPWDDAKVLLEQPERTKAMFYLYGAQHMQKIAAGMRDKIRETIQLQGFGSWPPLSPVTVGKKGHETMLVETGAMYWGIKWWRLGPRSWAVGLDDSPHPTIKGLTMAEVGEVHEYGAPDYRIPPRPFLGPTVRLYIMSFITWRAPILMQQILRGLLRGRGAAIGPAGELLAG